MKTITAYQSEDGQVHPNKEDAVQSDLSDIVCTMGSNLDIDDLLNELCHDGASRDRFIKALEQLK